MLDLPLKFGSAPVALLSFMQGYSSDLGEVEVRLTDVVEPSGVATAALHQRGEAGDAFKARGGSTQKAWQKNFFHVDGMRPDGVRVTQSSLVTIQAGDTRMQNYAFNPEIARAYDGILGFGVPPFAQAVLRVKLLCKRAPTCKFKILYVASC